LRNNSVHDHPGRATAGLLLFPLDASGADPGADGRADPSDFLADRSLCVVFKSIGIGEEDLDFFDED
jgi:hypothetical protein